MDEVVKQCNQLVNTLKAKHKLKYEQAVAFDYAITLYDYLQNDGVIFKGTTSILNCFENEERPIKPNRETVIALCEYIIGTIQFYDIPIPTLRIKSEAGIRAKEIIAQLTKGGE